MRYPGARQGARGDGCQAAAGGPRGAAAHWWAPQIGAACGAQGSGGSNASASAKSEATGGGASPPCDSRHKGQCIPAPAPGKVGPVGAPLSASGVAARVRPSPARSPAASAGMLRGPLLVHTSMPWAGAGTSADVTMGASVANAISPSASKAQARDPRRVNVKVRRSIPCMVYGGCKSAKEKSKRQMRCQHKRGGLCWPSLRAWTSRRACRGGARLRRRRARWCLPAP